MIRKVCGVDISKPRRYIPGAVLNHAAKKFSYSGIESVEAHPCLRSRWKDQPQRRAGGNSLGCQGCFAGVSKERQSALALGERSNHGGPFGPLWPELQKRLDDQILCCFV